MNGMQRKAAAKRHAARYTEDGLPRDAREWVEQDWRDLFTAVEEAKRKIKERHGDQGNETSKTER